MHDWRSWEMVMSIGGAGPCFLRILLTIGMIQRLDTHVDDMILVTAAINNGVHALGIVPAPCSKGPDHSKDQVIISRPAAFAAMAYVDGTIVAGHLLLSRMTSWPLVPWPQSNLKMSQNSSLIRSLRPPSSLSPGKLAVLVRSDQRVAEMIAAAGSEDSGDLQVQLLKGRK